MLKKIMFEMFALQNNLNIQTNGENWIDGITKEGRTINWKRCVYMEGSELLDSLNWKHWKDINKPDDMENAKVELVDIWHFLISDFIAEYNEDLNGNIQDIAEIAFKIYEQHLKKPQKPNETLIQLSEKIIKTAINGGIAINEFFYAIDTIDGFNMEEVYRLYLGKICLNQFRQDSGYKDGLYVKIWNGKEDNVYMQNFLRDNPNTTYKKLYDFLSDTYTAKNSSSYPGSPLVSNGMRQIIDT